MSVLPPPIRLALASLAIAATLGAAGPPGGGRDPWEPVGTFPVDEVSGLAASWRHPGVYWAIRDGGGGNRAVLLALRLVGDRLMAWPGGGIVRTIPVAGARNVDWEEVAADGRGGLWIAETGNNAESRRDLALLRVPEPDPARDGAARVADRVPIAYPDAPPWGTSFDAEALFFVDGAAYLITKTAGHGVYRVPALAAGVPQTLRKLGRLAQPPRGLEGLVSGASISRDGRRLAVVTGRRRVWVHEAGPGGLTGDALVQDLVARPPRWSAPFDAEEAAWQVEAVAFGAAGHDLLLAAEEGPIWRFPRWFYEGYR